MAELIQCAQFSFQLCAAGTRINVVVFCFKAAINAPAHRAVIGNRLLIGTQIQSGRLSAEASEQLIIQQSMLRSDLCRCACGHAGSNPVFFDEQRICACVSEKPRTEQSGDAAADDQHVSADITPQRLKTRQRSRRRPKRRITIGRHIRHLFPFSLFCTENK